MDDPRAPAAHAPAVEDPTQRRDLILVERARTGDKLVEHRLGAIAPGPGLGDLAGAQQHERPIHGLEGVEPVQGGLLPVGRLHGHGVVRGDPDVAAGVDEALLGLRVGLQSEEQLAGRIEADTAEMRRRGYLVASVETLSLPGLAGRNADAHWYRVTFEQASPPGGL